MSFPYEEKPNITKVDPGSSVTVATGKVVTLSCFAHGTPTPSVYWQTSMSNNGKLLVALTLLPNTLRKRCHLVLISLNGPKE